MSEREFYGKYDRLLHALYKSGYSPKEASDLIEEMIVAPEGRLFEPEDEEK